MKFDHSGEILLTALVVSAILHCGTMIYARPKVMTHVLNVPRTPRREAMRVTKAVEAPPPVRIDEVKAVDALREAPVAEPVREMPSSPQVAAREISGVKAVLPASLADLSDSLQAPKDVPVFTVKPLDVRGMSPQPSLPEPSFDKAKLEIASGAPDVAPLAPVPVMDVGPAVPFAGVGDDLKLGPERLDSAPPQNVVPFKPETEVREKVDEKLVEREKAAVSELLDVPDARELASFVDATLTRASDGQWTYFKVVFAPKASLAIVPKDVVILLDASGSIGRDRIRSVREAAKGLLRSCTNSGDRFNLVAFRDRYEYAFRRWQNCSESALGQADRWLDEVAAHGRTDVFDSIRSVLTLPRDPKRPLIALVVTDGVANSGISRNADILSKFTALNDGLVSVYMYGVKSAANRELIDVLTHGNRGESLIYDGWLRQNSGAGLEKLCARFRDPVLSDLRLVFSSATKAEVYPRRLRNLYRGESLTVCGRVSADTRELAFSIKGLNGAELYEGFFKLPFSTAGEDPSVRTAWEAERAIDQKLK